MHYGQEPVCSSRKVLEITKLCSKTKWKKTKVKRAKHEQPWNPNNPGKKGKAATLEKFPKHMPNPPKRLKRNRERENNDDPVFKPPFKGTLKKATMAISTRKSNLKKDPKL